MLMQQIKAQVFDNQILPKFISLSIIFYNKRTHSWTRPVKTGCIVSAHSFYYRLPKCLENLTLIWLLMIWYFYFIQSVLRAG